MAAQEEVDLCESWEDMDEIGLNHKIELMSASSRVNNISENGCTFNVVLEDTSMNGQYMMPEPSIKILKRPSSLTNGQINGESRSRPVKTLQQRQREYEQARLRILGEARAPEDVIDDNLSKIQDKLKASNLNENQQKSKERTVLVRGTLMNGNGPPPGVLVLRSPKVPDGTKGFAKR